MDDRDEANGYPDYVVVMVMPVMMMMIMKFSELGSHQHMVPV